MKWIEIKMVVLANDIERVTEVISIITLEIFYSEDYLNLENDSSL